jgi:hypothetical protein
VSRSLHIDQAFDWRESERTDKGMSLDLWTSGGTQGESRIYRMLEILEPTIGPLELFLVWSAAEDCESLLDCLYVGHIFTFKESERSQVALVIRRQSLFITT